MSSRRSSRLAIRLAMLVCVALPGMSPAAAEVHCVADAVGGLTGSTRRTPLSPRWDELRAEVDRAARGREELGLDGVIQLERQLRQTLPPRLREAAAAVSSPEELLEMLAVLGSLNWRATSLKLATFDFSLSAPISRLRPQLSAADKDRALQLLERFTRLGSAWAPRMPVYRLALYPEEILPYVRALPDNQYLNDARSGGTIHELLRALDGMPPELKEPLRAEVGQRYGAIGKTAEAETVVGRWQIRGPKVVKRNLEMIHRGLAQDAVGLPEA